MWKGTCCMCEHHTLEALGGCEERKGHGGSNERPLHVRELVTITAEVEAILNSRPLTPLSSDPSDLGALTLGTFYGDSASIAEQEINDEQLKSLDRWRCQGIKQNWRRWLADYFNELHIRSKGQSQHQHLDRRYVPDEISEFESGCRTTRVSLETNS
ncbi:hypothetical protein ACLKA6_013618 [Drosophila palustris]